VTRALVPGLTSPHPLGDRLPAMYLDDSFVQRMTGALDEVLAPVFSSMDNLDTYFDPALAPEDFVRWLGSWVGLVLDESLPAERQRAVLAQAVDLYRVRGTAAGLTAYLRLLTGADVHVEESGGTSYSQGAYPDQPGEAGFSMLVRLRPPGGTTLNAARVDALVAAAKPAHVVHRVMIITDPPSAPALAGEGQVPESPAG
jgi:phage tail-like protein